jgi:thioredoxin 1
MWRRLRNAFTGNAQPPTLPLEDRPATGPTSLVQDVTDADFDARVMGAAGVAVVDFWAEWCGPCETMSAYVEFLAKDFPDGLAVFALDVDENPATAERFTVMGLPTLLFLRDGEEVGRQVGLLVYDELQQKIRTLLAT